MAMNNTDEKYKVNGKASWDLAVYLNRQNPLPLDGTSIYNSLEAAQKYASENAKAYPGQIISVVTDTEVKVYKINKGQLEELGKCSLVTDKNPNSLATADNIGQIIYLTKDVKVTEGSGEVTYSPGPYIVSGDGAVSKIGTTSASGDITGVVAALQGKVSTLEGTVGKKGSGDAASTGLVKDVEDLAKKDTEFESGIIYDVSAHNDGAVFESLSALLGSDNLSTLIPTSVRHGGMSIRFIQSSDNKYVQYRLMTNMWSATVSDWQGVDDEPTSGSDNLVKSGGVADSINKLKNAGYLYAGIATPTTNPGTPDGPVFYIATTTGSYSNFSNIEVLKGESVILKWNSGIWEKSAFKPMTDFNSVFDDDGKTITLKNKEQDKKLSELDRTISDIEEYGVEYFTTGQVATPHIQEPFLPLTDDMVTITVRGFINNTAQIAINIAEDYDKPIKTLAANFIDIDDNNCYNYTFKKSDYPTAKRLYVSKGDGSHDEFCKITVNKGIISSKELSDNIESVNTKLTEYKNSNDSRVSDLENADIVINENISSLDSRVKELETKGEDLTPYGEGGLSNGSANELSAQFLTEEFDTSRNWYIEFVAKVNTTRNNKIFAIDWGINKNFVVIYLRHLTAPQFTLDDTNYANFKPPISWTNHEYAHYMLAKNETGISLFCNGILLQTVEYTATYSPSINKLHIALYTKNNFKLFRIGYYEVFDSLVAHYNNGNPFTFVEAKSNMIAEFLPENLTKTKATNTANGISLEYEEGKYEPITDNPWANPIKAEGSPVNVPLYAGQHYLDTTNNIMYKAIGNTQVTDWKKSDNPTFDDLDSLKEEIIEIGDRRWTGGSGGGSTAVVVTDYYKDGITEDSDAIEAAIEAAKNFGKVLYFPKGTYKLRRSIQLWDNAVIDGDKGAVLTHKAVDGNGCIMTTLSAATTTGDTTISVSSVAGLSVGDEIVIYDTTSGLSSYQETMCKITAINGNTLTIDATQWHGSVGVRRAYPVANTRITTDFALIHTPWVDGAHNCVIRNITLQANGNNNEPYVYSQSPIHIHSKNAYDISIKNIVVDGSVNDGISIQGSSKQRVIGCTIKGIKWKGVHWGTTSADVLVERCWFENCGLVASDGNAYNGGGGAIYSCYNNHKLRIVNNHITDCLRGVFGLDVQNSNSGEDGSWVVSGNVFDTPKNFTNRAGLGISVGGSNNGLITNNIFCRFGKNSTPITIDNSEDFGGNTFAVTISNNTFGHWQSNYVGDDNKGAIYVKGATKCIVNGNNIDNHYHDYGSTAAPTEISGNTNIIVDSCTKCVVTNNIVAGGKVEKKNTNTGCVITNNVVDIVE